VHPLDLLRKAPKRAHEKQRQLRFRGVRSLGAVDEVVHDAAERMAGLVPVFVDPFP
jgi:hypothetical protein